MARIKLEDKYTLIEDPADEGKIWFEYQQTLTYPPRRVWTIVESSEDESMWAQTGYHIVNVVYYAITEEEWTDEDIAIDYLWYDPEEERAKDND